MNETSLLVLATANGLLLRAKLPGLDENEVVCIPLLRGKKTSVTF